MHPTHKSVKNRSGSLWNAAVYDGCAQNVSWSSPGTFWKWFGNLPALSWSHLGRSWGAFGRSWPFLGRLENASWALLDASGLSRMTPSSILKGFGRLREAFSSLQACIFLRFCMRAHLAPVVSLKGDMVSSDTLTNVFNTLLISSAVCSLTFLMESSIFFVVCAWHHLRHTCPELSCVVTAMSMGPAAESLSTAFFTACSLPGVLPWML